MSAANRAPGLWVTDVAVVSSPRAGAVRHVRLAARFWKWPWEMSPG